MFKIIIEEIWNSHVLTDGSNGCAKYSTVEIPLQPFEGLSITDIHKHLSVSISRVEYNVAIGHIVCRCYNKGCTYWYNTPALKTRDMGYHDTIGELLETMK